jgi:hypothetical protein
MRALAALVLALCLCTPCHALDVGGLKQALPEDAARILQPVSPENADVEGGFSALWQGAKTLLRQGLKSAVQSIWAALRCSFRTALLAVLGSLTARCA